MKQYEDLIITLAVLLGVFAVIVGVNFAGSHKRTIMLQMVEAGANPIAAACAVNSANINTVLCSEALRQSRS